MRKRRITSRKKVKYKNLVSREHIPFHREEPDAKRYAGKVSNSRQGYTGATEGQKTAVTGER
jgi:hypothetical protein